MTETFNILEELKQMPEKYNKYDKMCFESDDEDYNVKLDDNLIEKKEIDSFEIKMKQVEMLIDTLKKNPNLIDSKMRKEIKSLSNHLEKLQNAKKNNIDYNLFKTNMSDTAKNDKNMNKTLKNLYLQQ